MTAPILSPVFPLLCLQPRFYDFSILCVSGLADPHTRALSLGPRHCAGAAAGTAAAAPAAVPNITAACRACCSSLQQCSSGVRRVGATPASLLSLGGRGRAGRQRPSRGDAQAPIGRASSPCLLQHTAPPTSAASRAACPRPPPARAPRPAAGSVVAGQRQAPKRSLPLQQQPPTSVGGAPSQSIRLTALHTPTTGQDVRPTGLALSSPSARLTLRPMALSGASSPQRSTSIRPLAPLPCSA